jgi:hypothetical protein
MESEQAKNLERCAKQDNHKTRWEKTRQDNHKTRLDKTTTQVRTKQDKTGQAQDKTKQPHHQTTPHHSTTLHKTIARENEDDDKTVTIP